MSTFNVFRLRVRSVCHGWWASSETVLGLPFDASSRTMCRWTRDRRRSHNLPTPSPKLLGENMAAQFNRRFGVPFVGLRFSNIMEEDDYRQFPGFWDDPHLRKWNLWGYVDARDVASSVRAALDAEIWGAEVFIVAAADTVMNRPSADLVGEVYPEIPVRRAIDEYETLLAIDKARDLLGYRPGHSWRDQVAEH